MSPELPPVRTIRVETFDDGSIAALKIIDGKERWTVLDWGPAPQHPDLWCDAAYFCRQKNGIGSALAGKLSFQARVKKWLLACFGAEIAADRQERNHCFLEEAIELVQAAGCTRSEAHQLVDYVFDRPVGELHQEVGGTIVTLAALCSAHEVNLSAAGEIELARIWTKIEKIRAKQAAKPKHSPLPEAIDAPAIHPDLARLVDDGSPHAEPANA